MDNMRSIVSLQQLPIEILAMIVEKLGEISSADYANDISTCTKMNEASKNPRVFHTLCLSLLVKKPFLALAHIEIMETCVDNENLSAYFIQGIIAYFIEEDPDNGLAYLELGAIGADADHVEVAYLYRVLRLLHGDIQEGEEFMALINWWDYMKNADDVWASLRVSLHGINVRKKRVSVQSLMNMMPTDSCHLRDLQTACPDYFHYKRAVKFFHMYRGPSCLF